MNKKYIQSVFILLLTALINLSAQQIGPNISFEKTVHDFGQIEEKDGKATCRFEFINTGNEPLIINNVRASCGCTASEWTKKPVKPGEKGFLKVTYNPKNRPGKFMKSVSVKTNANEEKSEMLKIKGVVIPKPETLAQQYPSNMGKLRLKSNHLGFGKVFKNQKKTKKLEVVNFSDKDPINISFSNVPNYIDVKITPGKLEPKRKGTIEVTYNAEKVSDWGFVINRIKVIIDDEKDRKHRFTISANITEDFTNLTQKQRANAPKIKFNKEIHDFGDIPQNKKATYEFEFTNAGKTDLKIRKIKSTCGCTVVQPKDKTLGPGESSSLKATFTPGNRKGIQNKIITIITNDPYQSVKRLYLKANVDPSLN